MTAREFFGFSQEEYEAGEMAQEDAMKNMTPRDAMREAWSPDGEARVIDHVDVANLGRRVVVNGRVVAECYCFDADTNDANARRIAAGWNARESAQPAPGYLVEALRSVVEECSKDPGDDWDPDTINRCRAALARAEEQLEPLDSKCGRCGRVGLPRGVDLCFWCFNGESPPNAARAEEQQPKNEGTIRFDASTAKRVKPHIPPDPMEEQQPAPNACQADKIAALERERDALRERLAAAYKDASDLLAWKRLAEPVVAAATDYIGEHWDQDHPQEPLRPGMVDRYIELRSAVVACRAARGEGE